MRSVAWFKLKILNIYLKNIFIQMKKNILKINSIAINKIDFFLIEISIFLTQILIIFFVAFFISHMFSSETRFTEFINGRLNTQTLPELGITFIVFFAVLGGLNLLDDKQTNPLLGKIIREVKSDLPRMIYLFGSSITATTLAVAVYVYIHPQESIKPFNYFGHAAFFAINFFVYGCVMKYYLLPENVKKEMVKYSRSNN